MEEQRPPTQEDFNKFYEEYMNFLLENEVKVILYGEQHYDIGSIPFYMASLDLKEFEKNVIFKVELGSSELEKFKSYDFDFDTYLNEATKDSTNFAGMVFVLKEAELRGIKVEGDDPLRRHNGDDIDGRNREMVSSLTEESQTNTGYIFQISGALHLKGMQEGLKERNVEHILVRASDSREKINIIKKEAKSVKKNERSFLRQNIFTRSPEIKEDKKELRSALKEFRTMEKNLKWVNRNRNLKQFEIDGDIYKLSFKEIIPMMDKARENYINNHPEIAVKPREKLKREYTLPVKMRETLKEFNEWESAKTRLSTEKKSYLGLIEDAINDPEFNKLPKEIKKIINNLKGGLKGSTKEDIGAQTLNFTDNFYRFIDEEKDTYNSLSEGYKEQISNLRNGFLPFAGAKEGEILEREDLEGHQKQIDALKNKGFIRN